MSRAGRTSTYPANFQLLMAVNPCPCGNYGSKSKICLCSTKSIEQYWKKFSAPLLDRIDLRVFVDNPDNSKKEENDESISTEKLRENIRRAIIIQRKRQGIKNAKLTPQQISDFCKTDSEGHKLLENTAEKYNFSPRAISSCLKTARTIADMEGCENISVSHLKEAISFRKLCCNTTLELE